MDIKKILSDIAVTNASDIFVVAGQPLTYKLHGFLKTYETDKLLPKDTKEFLDGIYEIVGRDMTRFRNTGDDDFSFTLAKVARFRVSAYKQRNSYAAVIRIISFELPSPEELLIPDTIMKFSDIPRGMVLVTGPAGGGKSTTLACLINRINEEKPYHIITLEDPLEFLHSHKKSIVSQREINSDTESYLTALRSALRQSPNVILLGEMRDYETINTAITAAETGHLIFSTLHTIGASNTIERIVDSFPASQQHQISIQLASVLEAIISQKLLPTVDGKIVPAFEIMTMNTALRNLIRENKTHQIDSIIYSSQQEGMLSMDTSIYNLYKQGIITKETAVTNANNTEMMLKRMGN